MRWEDPENKVRSVPLVPRDHGENAEVPDPPESLVAPGLLVPLDPRENVDSEERVESQVLLVLGDPVDPLDPADRGDLLDQPDQQVPQVKVALADLQDPLDPLVGFLFLFQYSIYCKRRNIRAVHIFAQALRCAQI